METHKRTLEILRTQSDKHLEYRDDIEQFPTDANAVRDFATSCEALGMDGAQLRTVHDAIGSAYDCYSINTRWAIQKGLITDEGTLERLKKHTVDPMEEMAAKLQEILMGGIEEDHEVIDFDALDADASEGFPQITDGKPEVN